ncbi:hypothetical protein ISS30_10860 [bacterium]|nr:hypothetical protein [bacterium]
MRSEKLYSHLMALAERIALPVREEKGDFHGGLCIVDGEEAVFLNRDHDIGMKVSVLAKALACKRLDQIFMLPAVREMIDKYRIE